MKTPNAIITQITVFFSEFTFQNFVNFTTFMDHPLYGISIFYLMEKNFHGKKILAIKLKFLNSRN